MAFSLSNGIWVGTSGVDARTDDENPSTALGFAGNDIYLGMGGSDSVSGGLGDDTLYGGNDDDLLIGDEGNDSIYGDDGNDALFGGSGLDVLYGGIDDDSISGGDGADILNGGDDDDLLLGEGGNDNLLGDNGNDTAFGGADNDLLDGGSGNDLLVGGDGNDYLIGGIGDDELFGGQGVDTITAGEGNDTLDGGDSEYDVAIFAGVKSDYIIQLQADGSYRIEDTNAGRDGTDILANIEELRFLDITESITSSSTVFTEPVMPALTAPVLALASPPSSGSSGRSDTSSADPSSSTASTPATQLPEVSPVDISSPEVIATPSEESPVLGIQPQATVTTVQLTTPLTLGNLQVTQAVVGTPERDVITGSDEGEALAGGKGKDQMTGGGGPDAFIFETPGEFGKKNADVITDFNPDEGDRIIISSSVFNGMRNIRFASASDRDQLRKCRTSKKDIVYDNRSGSLYFNSNGKEPRWGDDGGLFAQLLGAPDIGKSDFVIV